MDQHREPPITEEKAYDQPSVFRPENLMREARRQKGLGAADLPKVCVLDPDGDVVTFLHERKRSRLNGTWACYHTKLYDFELAGIRVGIIGQAVGASFAVLLAEQLFASGCRLLVSMTSAGQLRSLGEEPPYFVLLEKALRDEGTSYHYLPPGEFASAPAALLRRLGDLGVDKRVTIRRGASWTTDAPYRETPVAVARRRDQGLHVVEMEAAALYAFAEFKAADVVCFAHVTNQMAVAAGDFEKGEHSGAAAALEVIRQTIGALRAELNLS